MSTFTAQSNCPCTSGKPYGSCCQPIQTGKAKAKSAEELLRARYSSFVTGNIDFILATHHSSTKHDVNREEIESWSKGSTWKGLEILQKEAGEAKDETGTIIFHAKYDFEGKEQDHYEKSTFEKEGGEWKFLDAMPLRNGPYVREEPKIGRNDPCSCGSGKKYKKCHGAAA
jgi:SEC-C motif-containing protein